MNYYCPFCNNVVQSENLVLAHVRAVDYAEEFYESSGLKIDGNLRIENLSAYLMRSRLPEEIRLEVIFDFPIKGTSGMFIIKSYVYHMGLAKLAVYCSVCEKLHHLNVYQG